MLGCVRINVSPVPFVLSLTYVIPIAYMLTLMCVLKVVCAGFACAVCVSVCLCTVCVPSVCLCVCVPVCLCAQVPCVCQARGAAPVGDLGFLAGPDQERRTSEWRQSRPAAGRRPPSTEASGCRWPQGGLNGGAGPSTWPKVPG